MERYRSGHNGADSKSDGQGNLARGFESHPLRPENSDTRTCRVSIISIPKVISDDIGWSLITGKLFSSLLNSYATLLPGLSFPPSASPTHSNTHLILIRGHESFLLDQTVDSPQHLFIRNSTFLSFRYVALSHDGRTAEI